MPPLVLVGIVLTAVTALARTFQLAGGWLYVGATVLAAVVAATLAVLEATKGSSRAKRVRAVTAVLGVTALLVGAFWVLRPEVENLIEAMTGDLNIAVAEFGPGTEGDDNLGDAATALSESLYDFLSEVARGFRDEASDLQLRAPSEIGQIEGDDRASRATRARELAEEINADVVLYGVLNRRSGGGIDTVLEPEFILNGARVSGALELTGHHTLGTPIVAPGEPSDAQRSIRSQTQARIFALARFMIGLSYYRVEDYDSAFAQFEEALDTPEWRDEDGKELVYLFLGNAESRRRRYQAARSYYGEALALNSEFGRARVGLAELEYLAAAITASDGTDRAGTCGPGTVDAEGLVRSREMYQAAARATDQSGVGDVDLKATYGLGRVELCRYLSGEVAAADSARTSFAAVIEGYEGGRNSVRGLAAESYANLAVLESTDPDGVGDAVHVACAVKGLYELAVETSVSTSRADIFDRNMQPSLEIVARAEAPCSGNEGAVR